MRKQRKGAAATEAAEAARAWRTGLSGQRRRSSCWRGLAIFALSGGLYGALFLAAFLLPAWWARAAALLVTPLVIGALFVIAHDACHHSLTPLGWLNRLLGRIAMLPAWHPYTSWAHAHNTLHHGWTNFKGRHPDFAPFSKEEFDHLPAWRRGLERIYRSPLGIGLYYTFDFYCKYLLFPCSERRSPFRLGFHLDRLLVLGFLIGQLACAWLLAGWTPSPALPRTLHALGAVLLPWLVWIWFMGFMSFLQHTHPGTAWYDNDDEWSFYHVQLRSSTHVVFPWPIERILHNIMDHPAHHIDPTIPLYELPASQRELERQAPEHSLIVRWTLREYLRICRVCKLYDYRRHCWLDFAGRPTTPEGLHRAEKGQVRARAA